MMKKRFLSLLSLVCISLSALASCDDQTSSSQVDSSPASVEEIAEYEDWINSWSEEGHLYIHYLREGASEAEYDNYAIWIWQSAPIDSEGSLWGASNPNVQNLYNYMSTSWMENITPNGGNVDQYGKIMDIDMTRTDIIGGNSGSPVSLIDAERVGFLICDQSSMDGSKHWTSDGGRDTYISDFQDHFRENGSMHIFCVKGSVSNFSFYSEDLTSIDNPTVEDTTGQYASTSDVDSSNSLYTNSVTSDSFSSLGVGYQIFVASFRDSNGDGLGDLRGIIDSLDYLEDLGVQTLWLTPIQTSSSYHGYDTIDYYEIDPKFGTLDDYRELIYECHKRGIKIIMDLVLNHTSTNNIWFTKSQRAEKGTDPYGNPINYRNLYHWKYQGTKVQYYDKDLGRYTSINVEDHPNWYRDGESNYYYYGKFGSNMAELNYDNQATRDFVISLAAYWLGFGLDGFRLDAVKHIYMKDEVDDTGNDLIVTDIADKTYYDEQLFQEVTETNDYSSDLTKNVNFWKEFAVELKNLYPDCFLVGENFDGYGARIAPYYQALDSQFDFSLYYHNQEWLFRHLNGMHASYMAVTQPNETYNKFSSSTSTNIDNVGLVSGGNRPDFINGAFTSNHDVARAINHINSSDGNPYDVQGNDLEINRAKVHAASTILAPGISWIYYGDELGMSGNTLKHEEIYGNTNNLDMWYRQPFKWGEEEITTDYTFGGYEIKWDDYNQTLPSLNEQETDSDSMLNYYRALNEVKKLYGKNAKYTGHEFQANTDVLHYEINSDNGVFYIYINAGEKAQNVELRGDTNVCLNGSTSTLLAPYGTIISYTLK